MNEAEKAALAAAAAESAAASAASAKESEAEIRGALSGALSSALAIRTDAEQFAKDAQFSSEMVGKASGAVGRAVAEAVLRIEAAAATMTAIQEGMAVQVGDHQEAILEAASAGIETIREAALVSKTVLEIKDAVREIRPIVRIPGPMVADLFVGALTPFLRDQYDRTAKAVLRGMPSADDIAEACARLPPPVPKSPAPLAVAAAFGGGAVSVLCAAALQLAPSSLAPVGVGLVAVGAVALAISWVRGGGGTGGLLSRRE